MARFPRPKNVRQSEYWLRALVNQYPHMLNEKLVAAFKDVRLCQTTWCSPLEDDDFAEYNDQSFIDLLGIKLTHQALETFWPPGGPHWDALGKIEEPNGATSAIVLVEAKAYIEELVTDSCQVASQTSLKKIQDSLSEARKFFGSSGCADWSGTFYQYTNRLAHLYFFRKLYNIDAYLAFIYFTHAPDITQPPMEIEWRAALRVVRKYLGIRNHPSLKCAADVYIDARELQSDRESTM